MKIYSIGREVGCDIPINDRTDVVSRRHAILNVSSFGKMTIIDQSSNGTYVNGIRIASNVPVPVTRRDNISFAHVARLDWRLVPNPCRTIMLWAMIGLAALLLIIGGVFAVKWMNETGSPEPQSSTPMVSVQEMENQLKQKEDEVSRQLRDSLRRDSLAKEHKKLLDNTRKETKKTDANKINGKKAESQKPVTKKPEEKKSDEPIKRIGR